MNIETKLKMATSKDIFEISLDFEVRQIKLKNILL
jgi:hypothetical protein